MYFRTKKALLLISILFIALETGVSANNKENFTLSPISAGGYMGENTDLIRISPLDEKETWLYGEFDPSRIVINSFISGKGKKDITLKTFVRLKLGKRSFSSENGYDISLLKKTAKWSNRKLIENKVISLQNNNYNYEYSYSIDHLMYTLKKEQKWPYIIDFTIVIYDRKNTKLDTKKKTIYLIPDNADSH